MKIVRLAASLDLIELISPIMPRTLREVSQASERIAKEADRPHALIISKRI